MDVTLVEKRKASITAGDGCDVAGESLDDFGSQRGHKGLCHSGGLESACSATGRLMASVLGRTAQRVRKSSAARVGSDRPCRSGIVCPLALGRHCGMRLASVLTHQCGLQSPLAWRGEL